MGNTVHLKERNNKLAKTNALLEKKIQELMVPQSGLSIYHQNDLLLKYLLVYAKVNGLQNIEANQANLVVEMPKIEIVYLEHAHNDLCKSESEVIDTYEE